MLRHIHFLETESVQERNHEGAHHGLTTTDTMLHGQGWVDKMAAACRNSEGESIPVAADGFRDEERQQALHVAPHGVHGVQDGHPRFKARARRPVIWKPG